MQKHNPHFLRGGKTLLPEQRDALLKQAQAESLRTGHSWAEIFYRLRNKTNSKNKPAKSKAKRVKRVLVIESHPDRKHFCASCEL